MLEPYKAKARSHPDGIVDLSIGTPVDPVPAVVREALVAALERARATRPSAGTPALREAAAGWLARRHAVSVDPDAVLPLIGTKELIAWLPTQLGLRPGRRGRPSRARLPDLRRRARGWPGPGRWRPTRLVALGPEPVRLWWLNSPSNPTGRVLPAEHLRKVVAWARERGTVVASDECYIELGWEAQPVSVLHPDVCGGSHQGLLAVHSLSKRSNMAGYRAGFVTGDPELIAELLEIRKHAGMIVPGPVQAATVAALNDDGHADAQRARYAARRALLRPALEAAGWAVEHSRGRPVPVGLHPGRDCWALGGGARRGRHPGRARRDVRPGRRAARPGGADRDRRADRRPPSRAWPRWGRRVR